MVQGIEQTYEGMFLVNAAAAAEDWDGVIGTIERVMQRAAATITKITKWDERRLCYSIGGQKRGVYILCYFTSSPEAIGKIERDVQLNETILRVLILRADRIPQEIKDAPTPFMQAQQQKQVAKAASESSSAAESKVMVDDSIESPGVDDVSDSFADEVNEGDIPDILETFAEEDDAKSIVSEKPQTDDIEDPESLPG